MFGKSSKLELTVEGMSCGHCESAVVKAVSNLSGVKKVKADHSRSHVQVFYKDDPPDEAAIRETIQGLGYEVTE